MHDNIAVTTAEVAPQRRRAALSDRLRALSIDRLTVAVVVLGLLWRTVRYALGFPIWGDEAFVAINFLQRDYRGMIEPLVYGQIVPLAFMWADLAVSRVLGLSEWSLRLVPYLAGVASLLLFYRLGRHVLHRRAAMLAIGFLASAYFTVRHTCEVKPYSADLLFSLLLTLLGLRVFERPRSLRGWIALIVVAAAAPWCSYPSVFVGGSVGALLLSLGVRERFRTSVVVGCALFGVVLVGSFAWMYVIYGRPHAQAAVGLSELDSWAVTFPALGRPWELPKWFYAAHLGNLMAYPHGGRAPRSLATFVLVAIGAWRLWKTGRPVVLLLLGPLLFTFVAAALHAYPYGGSARTAQYMAPAFCLLAGLGLYAVFTRLLRGPARAMAFRVAALALAGFALGGTVVDLVQPYKSTAVRLSREAVVKLAARTGPNDRWVVFNATERVDYAPYLGDWRGTGAQFVFDVMRFARVPLDWAPRPETVMTRPGGGVFLLSYRGVKEDFPEEQLAAYLKILEARLERPQHERFEIKRRGGRVEALDVYQFGNPALNGRHELGFSPTTSATATWPMASR